MIKIYNYQIFEWFPFAILLQLIYLIPCKFIHEPYCVGMVLILDFNKWHCRKSNLLALNFLLLAPHLAINQIDMTDSILPKYNQNLASSRKHIALLMHNNLKIKVHHRAYLQVHDISWHMELQCIFELSKWIFLSIVVWILDFFCQLKHSSDIY